MTKSVSAGHEMYDARRGRAEKQSDAELMKTGVGRGQLLRRASNGDRAARDLLKRGGHGEEFELGGDGA